MEIYKDIPGWEGYYQASNDGQIRSLDRISCVGRKLKGKILTLDSSSGYWQVWLWKNREREHYKVSVLVLLAHVGPHPGMDACHNDGKPLKPRADRLENLRWDTRSNNQLDRNRHGTDSSTYLSKAVLCVEISEEFKSGREAARQTGIHQASISRCCIGKQKTAGGFHWKFV